MKKLKILALNPFHGGSHKAFIDSWIARSEHEWTLLTLPGTRWKWRLHFSAVQLASEVKKLYEKGERWDHIFCTSMMNVAEFRGLCPELAEVPITVYFHENQLTYPESTNVKFSLGLCMTNVLSALAADRIWFNSEFHMNDFIGAAKGLLKTKNEVPKDVISSISLKSSVHYLGIDDSFYQKKEKKLSTPVKLVWAARWEEDKNPGLLFLALKELLKRGVDFRISVLGEAMKVKMPCFAEAQKEFADKIDEFGYAESREEYQRILKDSDVFISTADHEFFGLAALEAVAAGCVPVVPDHLAYPEVLAQYREFFYKPRSSVQLADKVEQIVNSGISIKEADQKFRWSVRAVQLDQYLAR